MPELATMIKAEYDKIILIKDDKEKLAEYVDQVNSDNKKVVDLMVDYVKKHDLKNIAQELTECIRDTIHCEALVACEGDFTHIEAYVLASRCCVQKTYIAIFMPSVDYDPDQAIAYIMSPNTHEEHEEQDEIMKWYRLMADYHGKEMDNEDEQLQKGRSKRKSNPK